MPEGPSAVAGDRSTVGAMAAPVRHLALPLILLITVKVLGRRWMAHWGATAEERTAELPGDEVVEGEERR